MPALDLGEITVAYTVRVSKRAKRISVRFSQRDGLQVVYPLGVTSPGPEELLREKSDWVLATRERFLNEASRLPPRAYEDGEIFHVLGRPYTLKLLTAPESKRATLEICNASLVLTLPDSLDATDPAQRRHAVEAYYRALAVEYLPARVGELAATHGFQFGRVRVKNQKTRWGSCSSRGNINLNLRLMMAPEPAIDYVIVHELCHLQVLNHSRAFWLLVEACFPDYRRWRDWFKKQGASLTL